MRSPAKESRHPNQGPNSAAKKRPARGAPDVSPSKKQQRKPSKKDRRRVSFAPDPELTLVHHFVKDDDYTSNSEGQGRVVVQYDDPAPQHAQPDAQHPALAGTSYQPGFWNKTVPENSPLNDPLPMDSPGMVSMELTQPTIQPQQHAWSHQQQQPGEETAGLPSLGALAEADELEEAEEQQQPVAAAVGEVTAALPSLGALADADEWEEEQGMQQQARAAWADVDAAATAGGNITAALPGLGSLVEEDEDAACGMDITEAAGRVLEHNMPAQQQQQQAFPDAELAAAPSPAAQQAQAASQHPALAVAEEAAGEAELEPTARVTLGRVSNGTDGEAARAAQLSKWGFAPGNEDTLEINLERHGRMIMGDQTFSRMYCDNTTGDSRYERPGAADETEDSLLLKDDSMGAGTHGAAEPSPGVSQRSQQPPLSAGRSPAAQPQQQAAVPNWTAPAFLPPYMQAPANSAPSDHPALAHSPDVTNSSLNTLETRRVSVDMRRVSINSRRFSMQDATGRLLVDDDDDIGMHLDAGLQAVAEPAVPAQVPDAAEGPASGTRARRRSSGAAFMGRDVTEKLLVDDDSMQEDVGPLADLRRQMRMLSQGSPVLMAQHEQTAPVQQIAPEQAQLAAAVAEPANGAALAQLPAKTPRTTVSLGYADSHNPATMGLLRSGGTTRLLQETVNLRRQQQELDEEELLEAEQAGQPLAGEELQADGGMTARTNGTTKLLADMTMASVVGAKLLGSAPVQGTPELVQAGDDDGLTDCSLGQFERPPELAGRHQEAEAAMEEAAQQQMQQLQEYASPALAPAGGDFRAGYPVGELARGDVIPGGPRLARTPVQFHAAPQPRSAHGTPHSNARSVRSQDAFQPHHHQHTPGTHGTHGTHRLARTPGSMLAPPAAAYPTEADVTADNVIPGGPKLARTPVGRTPGTGYLPGSAMAQHHPSGGRMVQFASGPGSASVHRYPGSAVALHRSGMTPQYAPPPMTFQDFTKLTEVQFLDNLRRGASINYADLQPNPVPQNLAEAYRLLTIISPQVTTLENGIRILQEEVQARRVSAADAEQLVGQANPAAFQKVQQADDEGLEVLREHVGLLKKVCRQKAVYCLKDVRRQMEESRGARLRRNLEALQGDLAFAQNSKQQMEEVAQAAEQFVRDQHLRMNQEEQQKHQEAERRTAVAGMQRALAQESAAIEQRRQQLQEVQARVAKLREEHGAMSREREALRKRSDALQVTVLQSQGDTRLRQACSPQAIVKKLEDVDVLTTCAGWQLEVAQEDTISGEAVLRLADVFRLRLNISRTAAFASIDTVPEAGCKLPADRRAMLAAIAGHTDGMAAPPEVRVSDANAAKVAALVQATTARLSRVADLAAELDGLRLAFPALSDVVCSSDGSLMLVLVNLDAEVKFAVTLRLPDTYPVGPVQQEAKIWFDGEGQVTEQRIAQAVETAAEAPGRLRSICRQLSVLARNAMPRPAVSQDAAFHTHWQNPLFGSTPVPAVVPT